LIEATDVLLLAHVPVPASVNGVVAPTHKLEPPLIGPGKAFTTKGVVTLQPVVARAYVIVGVPATIPVTSPVPIPIVACDVLLLVQVPPDVGSDNAVVEPAHTLVIPAMAPGKGLTVTTDEVTQPVGAVYVMFVVPALTPVTTPLPMPMVAKPGALLVQVPPERASVKVVVAPEAHTESVPLMAAGNVLTVTTVVAGAQPVAKV
jgi:hypothetical protein